MYKNMPIGRDDFADVRQGYYYVDKTQFLADFLHNHAQVTLFTRPRRFGKTMTLSMLRYFMDIEGAEQNRQLFTGLAIAQDAEAMALQGTRPVLALTLKGWTADTWEMMQEVIVDQLWRVCDAQSSHLLDTELTQPERDLFNRLRSGTASLIEYRSSLAFVMQLMSKHYGQKAVLLLDEYDVPIQSAWEHGYYRQAVGFFRELLSSALKTNPVLDFAVLTGVLRIAKENIFSSLNNLEVDSVLQQSYPEAFGFTPEDIQQMTKDFGCEEKMPELQKWYDGYRFAGKEVYNPWSVVNYFHHGCKPRAYWVNTSGNAILGEMLCHAWSSTLDELVGVMQGGSVHAMVEEGFIYNEIYRNQDALYTMLVTTGYFTTVNVEEGELGVAADLVLPNREIRSLFRREVLERYRNETQGLKVDQLMQAFTRGDIATVREGLGRYLEMLTSSFDAAKGHEAFYHGFVLGMTATLLDDYHIRSNHESGYGRYDIAAIPRRAGLSGIIVECKTAERTDELIAKAEEALAQITERDYDAELRAQGVPNILHYGIAFCGKKLQVAFAQVELERK